MRHCTLDHGRRRGALSVRHGTIARRGSSSFADVVICQMLAEFYYVRRLRTGTVAAETSIVSIINRMTKDLQRWKFVVVIMLKMKHSE